MNLGVNYNTARSIRGRAVFHLLLNGVHGPFRGRELVEERHYIHITATFCSLYTNNDYLPCISLFLFLFRIIVGAPKGTFPGGLDLIDHGQPAINRTGLVYACSITPQTMCQAVLGDESLFQNGDQINNDGLHGAGRLFDHRRMYNFY